MAEASQARHEASARQRFLEPAFVKTHGTQRRTLIDVPFRSFGRALEVEPWIAPGRSGLGTLIENESRHKEVPALHQRPRNLTRIGLDLDRREMRYHRHHDDEVEA